MTTGTFSINGTEFTLQPSEFRWLPRNMLGMTGDGHPIYSAVRQFEIRWNIGTAAEFDQLVDWFDGTHIAGTAVINLPQWNNPLYYFYPYSGCTLHEPEFGKYFAEHPSEVVLIVDNIHL